MSIRRKFRLFLATLLGTVFGTTIILLIAQFASIRAVERLEATHELELTTLIFRTQAAAGEIEPQVYNDMRVVIEDVARLWGLRPGSEVIRQIQQEHALLAVSGARIITADEAQAFADHIHLLTHQSYQDVVRVNKMASRVAIIGSLLIVGVVVVGINFVYWGLIIPLIKLRAEVSHHIATNASIARKNSLHDRHDAILDIERALQVIARRNILFRKGEKLNK